MAGLLQSCRPQDAADLCSSSCSSQCLPLYPFCMAHHACTFVTGDGGNGAATTTLVDVNGCPGTGTGGATDPGAGNSNYVQYPTLVQGYSGGYCNATATYPGLAYCPTSQPEWSAYRCGPAQSSQCAPVRDRSTIEPAAAACCCPDRFGLTTIKVTLVPHSQPLP